MLMPQTRPRFGIDLPIPAPDIVERLKKTFDDYPEFQVQHLSANAPPASKSSNSKSS